MNKLRAREQLQAFAAERSLTIAAWYVENESGAKLAGPELFRLLGDRTLVTSFSWSRSTGCPD